MEYHIVWKIDIEADSFEEAARIARESQRDPYTLATHFEIECETGEKENVWADDDREKGMNVHIVIETFQGNIENAHIFLSEESARQVEEDWLHENKIKDETSRQAKAQDGTECLVLEAELKS